MRLIRVILTLLSVTLAAPPVIARDAALLAAGCAACHGTRGYSEEGMPSLAGLDEEYLRREMARFASGERQSTVMMKHAQGYSEAEIRLLADYFAAQSAPRD